MPWPVMSRSGIQQRKYVNLCYLSHLWDFMDDIDTHLWFEFDQWLSLQCIHDTSIMDTLLNLPRIMKQELVHAQCCQLYLGTTTMVDICTSNGHYLCEWALNGQDHPQQSTFQFPHQSQPSKTVWNT